MNDRSTTRDACALAALCSVRQWHLLSQRDIDMTTTKNRVDSRFEAGEMRALGSTALAGDDAPTRVLLAPWGAVESTNGSFVVDDEAARLVITAFAEHGTDLPIDFEHQTLGGTYASPSGQAPAAGWIKGISADPGIGLYADIEWTEQASRLLAGKQYRYLSPVAIIRKLDRRLVAVHSAALTNKPAIRGMTAIVNRASPTEGDDTTLTPMARLREALQLDESSDVEVVLAAASRRISELESATRRHYVSERIAEAMRAGKLVEAQRAWAEALVAKEAGLFEEWLATAPVVVATGRLVPPGVDGTEGVVRGAVAQARAEYRTHPFLSRLTTEDAFVACALRGRTVAAHRS